MLLRAIVGVVLMLLSAGAASARTAKIDFWNEQRRGADYMNSTPTREWWVAAREAGIRIVRLFPNQWPTARRDFLVGDADKFERLDERDLKLLRESLDHAESVGLKVVLTTTTLPGLRWRQQNGDKDDLRLWRDFTYHAQAAEFWRQLAAALKDHRAVVGYNILNEPHPERATGFDDFWTQDFVAWYAKVEQTPADLNLFYRRVVAAIREVDRETPVVLDSGLYATPWAFKYLKPLADARIIYSFHMAEPWGYTTRRVNQGRYAYPGVMPVGSAVNGQRRQFQMNAVELERFHAPVIEWQRRHKITSRRIFVGEFGCSRSVEGAAEYLSDLIKIFNKQGWHWAFYQFRADGTWTERDYEYGTRPPGAAYWEAVGRGERPQLPRVANPLWDVFRKALNP
ncbi:MAG TPA: cellulase family glycosylhydrolase [Pyrinomonadaceae bacterium]|nr:cellulase family glycosylhydrolase [Pyrinomonadaceae bacterium]